MQNYYEEINKHLLQDETPSMYFNEIINPTIEQEYPLSLLYKLKLTEQSKLHHLEGNVWNHTMMVLDYAAKLKEKSNDKRVFMWAALLHDIGKPDTTKNKKGKITAYNHDKVGYELSKKFLKELTDEDEFIEKVGILIKYHMQILYVVKDLPFSDIISMKNEVSIYEVALLGFCDRMGRLGTNKKQEEDNVKLFIEKCKKYK